MTSKVGPRDEIHVAEPRAFLAEVYSFRFWFDAVQGYVSEPPAPAMEMDDDERERAITAFCNYCVGETAALDGASGLIRIAPNRDSKIFLATQVADEARHLEVFLQRLGQLGVADPEAEILKRASPRLLEFRRRLLELVSAGEWDEAIFAQNVILEAMEFSVFLAHAEVADESTAALLRGVIADERRHMGFGENDLGRRLRHEPGLSERLERVRRELDPMVLAAFDDTLVELNVPTSDRPDLGKGYLAAVARLGIGS